jgi:ABC-type molybdate transport system substrate-binding protein
VGLLPAPYELATLYSIAIPKRCKNPEVAQGLMARLLSAEFAATRSSAGFDAD